jgi:SAM-dependent methyltransferase
MMTSTKSKVILVAKNSLERDTRTLTEAEILARAGLEVVVIGVRGATHEAFERKDGFYIKRVENSFGLALAFSDRLFRRMRKTRLKPLSEPILSALRYLDRRTRTPAIYVRLFKLMLTEAGDFYHAHSPPALMALTSVAARLKGRRFLLDYNDIIVLEKQDGAGLSYYEQEDLWGGEIDERNASRIRSTIRELPKGDFSLLDVGCGDGRLTNQLLDLYPQVVGLDTSREALQYVKTNSVAASALEIPWSDGSFDIILATELLEHLPDEAYRRALAEMKRVARKWILIGVPWKEQLSIAQARCARCGVQFHANYHWRSFDERRLRKLLSPEFEMVTCGQIGVDKAYYVPWLLWINRRLGGIWTRTPATVCPECGTPLYPGGFPERNSIRNFCDSRNRQVKSARTLEKSHVVALFKRKI